MSGIKNMLVKETHINYNSLNRFLILSADIEVNRLYNNPEINEVSYPHPEGANNTPVLRIQNILKVIQ